VGVTVTATSDELDVAFATPLSLGWGNQMTLRIDIDLAASLAGDPASGSLTFTPVGTATVDDGSDPLPVEEFLAELRSVDYVRSTLVVRGNEHGNPLGALTVHLDAGTLLLDEDDVQQTNAAFLLGLPGVVLEIEGFFANGGEFHATRVEVGDFDVVERVEGRVIGLDLANRRMTLANTQFETDTVPGPELIAAPDPIVLGWEVDTPFLLRDPASLTTEASLVIGQAVEARVFTYGAGEPVPVTEVEIERLLPTFEGKIVSVAGPTTIFVAELAAHDPAVRSGLVETSTTSVVVDHGGTGLVLATAGEPELDPAELQVGLEFECTGTLSGPPDSPTIQAAGVRVLPGWLDDALLGVVSAPTSSFKTTQGELRDPFGPGVTPGPLDVLVDPECVFTGDVTDAASFFALFGGGASPGASLDVFGLGTDAANTIRAYAIRVKTL
jgi:hypothetical protein